MAHKTEFLYMSEPDTIAAGVLDARKCIDNAEEVFTLLAKGDYLMGGNNHNNHGMYIVFPKESEFPNMPVAGPDRRFVAMPAYLGGRFDICGQKWYGSNAAEALTKCSAAVERQLSTAAFYASGTGQDPESKETRPLTGAS